MNRELSQRTPRKTKLPARERPRGLYDPNIRKLFLPQLLAGLTFTTTIFYIGYYHGGFILPTTQSSENILDLNFRLSYALRCSFPMILSLLAGIVATSVKRRLSDAINPLSGHENLVQVEKNYLANTLEQLAVGLSLMLIMATYAESTQVLRLLPVYSVAFTLGRLLFRIGYRKTNYCAYRETGMSLNYGSTFIMMCIVVYYVCTRGISYGLPGFYWTRTLIIQSTHCMLQQLLYSYCYCVLRYYYYIIIVAQKISFKFSLMRAWWWLLHHDSL